jgi:hypothetical protein
MHIASITPAKYNSYPYQPTMAEKQKLSIVSSASLLMVTFIATTLGGMYSV